MEDEKYLSEREISKMFNIKEITLQQQRYKKVGLPWIKIGGIVKYPMSAVNKYISKQLEKS